NEPELRAAVLRYQQHGHRDTCGGSDDKCRFNYPRPEEPRTRLRTEADQLPRGVLYVTKRGPDDTLTIPTAPRFCWAGMPTSMCNSSAAVHSTVRQARRC